MQRSPYDSPYDSPANCLNRFRVQPWRAQSMVLVATFIPSLLGAITILFESPRWLLMNGDAVQ